MNKEDTTDTAVQKDIPAINADGVSKTEVSPRGRGVLIRNANFSLKQGTIGALFGFSGSGKRVLLEIIAGLSKADSGTVFIFGTEMTALLPAQQQKLRREKVSIIFESTNLIEDLRIKQNLELSFMLANKPIDPGEFAKVVTLFGINDLLGNYPEEISLFEERKVALARAVLTKNPLLLVFQPSSNIAQKEQQELLSLLQLACHEYGITILFTTDFPHAASIADTVYLMRDSQLVGEIANPTSRAILFAIEALES